MNCKPSEMAFVIRNNRHAKIGSVVLVNHWTTASGAGRWDVEDMNGTFFLLHDDDLCPMRGWDIPKGFRDEIYDPVWIFGDFPDGEVDVQKLGQPKDYWRRA